MRAETIKLSSITTEELPLLRRYHRDHRVDAREYLSLSQALIGMERIRDNRKRVYVVEHLDPELGPWSALEYQAIARESASAGVSFCLSSVPTELELPAELREMNSLIVEHQSVETVFKDDKERICLLDPKGKAELSPEDAEKFDVFLFGGILGKKMTKC